jgi:hypothetical protein
MKVMVATAMLTLLIAVGWDRPYDQQFAAFRAVYDQLLMKLKPQPEAITIPMPTPAPEATAVDTTPTPPFDPPPTSSAKNNSWMWNKGVLDNPRQSGVDRSGVHTSEPLLQSQHHP